MNRNNTSAHQPPEYDWRNDPAFEPAGGMAHERAAPQIRVEPRRTGPTAQPAAQNRQAPAEPVMARQPLSANDATMRTHQPRPATNPGVSANPEGIRSLAEFEKARIHSQRVRFLRKALPVAGVLTIVMIATVLAYTMFAGPSIDLGQARFEDGKLVMRNPELNGTDQNARPYNLSADKAIQDSDQPSRIELQGIKAKLPMTDTEFAAVNAGNGLYDADAKTLLLGGKVAVDTDNGMIIRMEDADIDIESGRMQTRNPVSVDTGRARVTAEALTVSENGKVIVFENRVRMTLMPIGENDGSGENGKDGELRPAQSVVKE